MGKLPKEYQYIIIVLVLIFIVVGGAMMLARRSSNKDPMLVYGKSFAKLPHADDIDPHALRRTLAAPGTPINVSGQNAYGRSFARLGDAT